MIDLRGTKLGKDLHDEDVREVRDSYLDTPEWSCVALECDAPYELARLLKMLHEGRTESAEALKSQLLMDYAERRATKYGERNV